VRPPGPTHLVILSRGKAKEALAWTRGTLERLELTLNEKKTSIRDARRERFDFLGYSFGPHYNGRTGREYMGLSPSRKSVNRIKEKVGDILKPRNVGSWDEVRDRLNQTLTGWKAYFGRGSTSKAYGVIEEHVEERVRHFLRGRQQGVLARHPPVFEETGVWSARSLPAPAPVTCCRFVSLR